MNPQDMEWQRPVELVAEAHERRSALYADEYAFFDFVSYSDENTAQHSCLFVALEQAL